MNETKQLGEAVTSSGAAIMDAVVTYLPSVIGAVVLLLAGWVIARLLRAITVRSVLLLDTLLSRVTKTAGVERLQDVIEKHLWRHLEEGE